MEKLVIVEELFVFLNSHPKFHPVDISKDVHVARHINNQGCWELHFNWVTICDMWYKLEAKHPFTAQMAPEFNSVLNGI